MNPIPFGWNNIQYRRIITIKADWYTVQEKRWRHNGNKVTGRQLIHSSRLRARAYRPEMYFSDRLTKRARPNLYRLRFVFVLASSLFFIANYRMPRVIWWARWMLMSFTEDLVFWEYEVGCLWLLERFLSVNVFFFSSSDELPDDHKSWDSSVPRAGPLSL